MRLMIYLVLAVYFSFSSAVLAQVLNQFDLVCNIQVHNRQVESGATRDFSARRRYRIDLANNKWCENDCIVVEDIASNNDEQIVLDNTQSSDHMNVIAIDKSTGAFTGHYRSTSHAGTDVATSSGSCTTDEFSGIPNEDS